MYESLLAAHIMTSEAVGEWIEGISTNGYSDDLYYSLYLDLDDNTLLIIADSSRNA